MQDGVAITGLIGQEGSDWGEWAYLLLFFILPALSSLGQWIRKKSGMTGEPTDGDAPVAGKVAKPDRPGKRPPILGIPGQIRQTLAAPPPKPITVVKPPAARPVARATPQRPVVTHPPFSPPPPTPVARKAQDRDRAARQAMARAAVAAEDEFEAILLDDVPLKKPRRRVVPGRVDLGDLRRAIVLNEILQPPLALREEEHLPG